MNDLHYEHAQQRVKELRQQADKERLLKPRTVSWRVRSARALHGLARRLEPEAGLENDPNLETI
jgi:hypothetical protein